MNRPHSQHRQPPRQLPSPSSDVVVSGATGLEIGAAALERLEELDDAIFAALQGDPEALDRSRKLWRGVAREVAAPLVAESGAHYARQARTVWDATHSSPERSLARAFAALEVLGLIEE